MGDSHEGHDHGPSNLKSINSAFYIGIFLNAVFTAIEFIVGFANNSLALIADATHNLSDVASLIISLIGMRLAQKAATKLYSYGYKKASILASMINAVLLLFVVFTIVKEAVERFNSPPEVAGKVIIITALIGVLINTVSAYLFYKGQKDDINVKGAFLHLMVDALVSVGVVISGIVIYYTNWNVVDPIISLVIGVVILLTTWGLFKESLKLTLDGIPKGIDFNKIEAMIRNVNDVLDVHHIHIWALSTKMNALTAHVVIDPEMSMAKIQKLKKVITHKLTHENIKHVTLQIDTEGDCEDVDCS
ncbi:MAG: cation transporter [Kordia sp.]|nr:MAG: cation transporter [Kordia sp.]